METKICLNGYWDFLPLMPDENAFDTASENWICGRYLVPSSWRSEREMFNIFSYPEEWDAYHRGAIRRTVHIDYVPGTHVFLRLDAISQQAVVYINKTPAATITDMFLPTEVELTPFLTQGENDVEITVLCDDCPKVTRTDGEVKCLVPSGTWYANLCRGIWQDAWLITRGEAWVENCFVLTTWTDKTISVTANTQNADGCSLTGVILDEDGREVLSLDESLKAHWSDVRPWMPDDPYLYTLRLSLKRENDLLDVFDQRFGFREIRTVGPDVFINDVRIHLRGDAWHYQGLATQRKEYALNWYRMAKEQGINLIRPHGFPYPQCYYDAADECGMLIMAESGIYGSGKAMQADDIRFIDACKDHLVHFVRDYRNHPSVLIWSMQNEMRWVDGREGYKTHIPELMQIMASEDPSHRLVSCDGDNRLLTPEMMQAVSMHYNIDGRIIDWDHTKPLLFGEHGAFHYVAPQCTADFAGAKGYLNFWDAMNGVAEKEAYFLRYSRAEEVTGVTPFNYISYLCKAMPFEDVALDPGDVTAPGPHPNVLRAFSITANNGQLRDYPAYLPQKGMHTLHRETAQIAVLPNESDTRFFSGAFVTRSFRLYNDTYRDHAATVKCIGELDDGRIVFADERSFASEAGSHETLSYSFKLPDSDHAETLTLSFTLIFDDCVALKDHYEYRVMPHLPVSDERKRVVCFGKDGSVPACAAANVTYVDSLEALSAVSADLLILGEDLPYPQETLQPVLRILAENGKIGALLVLAQETFAPGSLVLSKRPFFSTYLTGSHPVTDGLTDDDLRFWNTKNVHKTDEGWLIANAWDKPKDSGWRVLMECAQGDFGWGGMEWCGMLEGCQNGIPVLLTQLRLGDYLSVNPIAEQIYAKSVQYLLGKATVTEPTVALIEANELADKAPAILAKGGTVIVSGCTEEAAPALSALIGRAVEIFPAETYNVCAVESPLTRNISNADLTGLDHVTYSAPSLHNVPVASHAIKAEGVQPLFTTVSAPWKELYIDDYQAEPVKIFAATRYDHTHHDCLCYGFAAKVGCGTLIVSQLLPKGRANILRTEELLAMNAGKIPQTDIFTLIKEPKQRSIPQVMWLGVMPTWNYEEAVHYHADPAFVLNNLGEGSYGWMQRVNAEDGLMSFPNSANKGIFATVFVDCALNHNPENRAAGEIPDPTIVPDLTVTCNTAFRVYVNGRCFEGISETPDKPITVTIEDTILEKGLNRVFFELLPAPHEIVLSAVFRDKLSAFLDDAKYRMTID